MSLSTSYRYFVCSGALPYCGIPPTCYIWDFGNTWESKMLSEALLA